MLKFFVFLYIIDFNQTEDEPELVVENEERFSDEEDDDSTLPTKPDQPLTTVTDKPEQPPARLTSPASKPQLSSSPGNNALNLKYPVEKREIKV